MMIIIFSGYAKSCLELKDKTSIRHDDMYSILVKGRILQVTLSGSFILFIEQQKKISILRKTISNESSVSFW